MHVPAFMIVSIQGQVALEYAVRSSQKQSLKYVSLRSSEIILQGQI